MPIGRHAALAALLLVALGACDSSTLERRVDGTIYAWMQCQDCMHNQRERVIALRDTAVPRLRDLMILGPPKSHDSAYVASLRRIAQRAPGVTPIVIERQRQRFANMYKRRARSALEAIAGDSARRALCLGRATAAPGTATYNAIDSSIARVGGACP
jgi:hypothetical protein